MSAGVMPTTYTVADPSGASCIVEWQEETTSKLGRWRVRLSALTGVRWSELPDAYDRPWLDVECEGATGGRDRALQLAEDVLGYIGTAIESAREAKTALENAMDLMDLARTDPDWAEQISIAKRDLAGAVVPA